jgi:invasion protein IalB
MDPRSQTPHRRNVARAIVTGAAFAFMLSASTGASAQAGAQPSAAAPAIVTQASSMKRVGLWTVSAWERPKNGSYCSAHRLLSSVVGGGVTLQLILIRMQSGYRLALSSERWDMTPKAVFPIELIASPVSRNDANAIVAAPKVVVIELGADGQFMKKLAIAPLLEIKTAQTSLNLPLEGFGEALTEVDACFTAIARSAANPFGAPQADLAKRTATYVETTLAQQQAGKETLRILLDRLLVAVSNAVFGPAPNPFAPPAKPTTTANAG